MPFLDATLAFALTMLAVSTVAGQLLDLGRKALGLRARRMREMLEEFFASELKPVIDREMSRLSDRVDGEVRTAVELVAAKLETKGAVANLFDPTEQLENVSTEELIERLKRSELGTKLLEGLNDDAEAVFDEIGKRWEVAGERVSASFRIYSGRWATFVALLVALTVNVDSWFILDSYLNDRQLTASVVAQLGEIQGSADRAIAAIARTDSALAANDTSAAVTLEELRADFETTRISVARLEESGLPLGWAYYPHACLASTRTTTSSCAEEHGRSPWMWGIGIILTALLAGLGAPFWYDAVSSVSRVARASRPKEPKDEA